MRSGQKGYIIFFLLFTIFAFFLLVKKQNLLQDYDSKKNSQSLSNLPPLHSQRTLLPSPSISQILEDGKKAKKKEQQQKIQSLLVTYATCPAYSEIDISMLGSKDLKALFTISPIDEAIYQRIYKKSYKENCKISLDSLRYVRVLHTDYDKKTRIGELIVNTKIAEKVKNIFFQLYQNEYPIEKMVLVDEYNADDNLSMADNNTSAFNYRVVEGTTKLSKHSLGLAIDINPRYNPYIHTLQGVVVCSPENGKAYQNRSKDFPYKIDRNDLAYQLLLSEGFTWGGAWNSCKDYQHFQFE